MRRSSLLHLLLVLAPLQTGAQQVVGLGGRVAEADLLYFAGHPLLAYEALGEHVESSPTDYEALWRMARAGVGAGFWSQNQYLDPALAVARRAVEQRPDGIDGMYWRGVAAGRRALNAGAGHAVELAQITYDDAHTILEADSLHAGAHNMLGKLNYEVMSLSRFERLIARIFMGNDAIKDTSWENAETHLMKAVEVQPDFVLFQFDLGQLYEKRGRDEEAIPPLTRARDLPVVHPIDQAVQDRATALLERILREGSVP